MSLSSHKPTDIGVILQQPADLSSSRSLGRVRKPEDTRETFVVTGIIHAWYKHHWRSKLNLGSWCYEAAAPSAVLLCHHNHHLPTSPHLLLFQLHLFPSGNVQSLHKTAAHVSDSDAAVQMVMRISNQIGCSDSWLIAYCSYSERGCGFGSH